MGSNETPECWQTTCEAQAGSSGISMCVHCGAELLEVSGAWYHWTSFDSNRQLIDGAQPQDYVRNSPPTTLSGEQKGGEKKGYDNFPDISRDY